MAEKIQETQEAAAEKNRADLQGISALKTFTQNGCNLEYRVIADWMTLRADDKPSAQMFYTAYLAEPSNAERPLTFLFNGGPGASSVFLHLGGVAPKVIHLNKDGSLPPPPMQLQDSTESWLSFTDLVFVDPVGTGFSHKVKTSDEEKKNGEKQDSKNEFYGIKRDLDALCEFIGRFLSTHHRWQSPLFIAGESYGGYRVARLAQQMNEQHGLGVNGAILISPALEFVDLDVSDYGISHYLNLFPSLVATSFFHGLTKGDDKELSEILQQSEDFALTDYVTLLASGGLMPKAKSARVFRKMTQLTGLPEQELKLAGGRVSFARFSRLLLKEQKEVIGWYDGTIRGFDPFPDRPSQDAPDPTLYPIFRVFKAGINQLLRTELNLETEREYEILNEKAYSEWVADEKKHDAFYQVSSMDDLRRGMAANPNMKVFICHGIHDLITPYFASKRFVHQMKLPAQHQDRVTLRNYEGGHMFYAAINSRKQWTKDIRGFFQTALKPTP